MKKVRLFLFIQSLFCVLLAAVLISAAVGICIDGLSALAGNPSAAIFTQEIAAERLRAAAPLFCACAVLTAAGLFLGIKDDNSLTHVADVKAENRAHGGKTLRTTLLAVAAVLIAAGILNGSAGDVFDNAVKICAECIGLG